MHIVGSQSKRTAVWNARRDAASLLKEESRTFANATAKIQNSRNFQKRKDKTELFNHNVLSQAEKGHRWTKDYCHVPSNATTRPDSAVPWAGVQNTKHYTPWAAICKAHWKAGWLSLYFLKLAFKSLWQMGEKYVIKVDISFLLFMFVKLILLSYTGRSVLNGNQTVAACS